MSPVRILLWHGYLLGGTGSNVYTRAVAREWSRAGHDVTSLYAVDHGDTTTDLYYDPVSCTKPRADVVRVNLP